MIGIYAILNNKGNNICQKCYNKLQRKVERLSYEILKEGVRVVSFFFLKLSEN